MLPLRTYLKNPSKIILGVLTHFPFLFSDKTSLKIQYRIKIGRKLDLENPTRFTEKLQWLKLYDRKPIYTKMVDKITAKEYVADIIGDQYIIPTLGTWAHFDEIDFDKLPDKFVMKTNHSGGGGGVLICKDKSSFNKDNARRIMEHSLKHTIFPVSREWPFKNVKPMILVEQLLEDDDEHGLKDYKFYCFNGVPKVLMIASNRFTSHNFNYFDMDFNPLPIESVEGKPVDNTLMERPVSFEEMKTIAKALSRDKSHVRVDLYEVAGKVYFGELTFFDSSGFDNLNSDKLDLEWGSWMTLPPNYMS